MKRTYHLIVFAKEPRVGKVKRRLAADIGDIRATFWYRLQLTNLLRKLNKRKLWKCHLFLTPNTASQTFPWPRGWLLHKQGPGDLGKRMWAAISKLPPGPVVLIGSDIPNLNANHIKNAFSALGHTEVVFGPSPDGGYWLIGHARRRRPPPFSKVRWSTQHTLEDSIVSFGPLTKIKLLEEINDIDTLADLADLSITTRGRSVHVPANEA